MLCVGLSNLTWALTLLSWFCYSQLFGKPSSHYIGTQCFEKLNWEFFYQRIKNGTFKSPKNSFLILDFESHSNRYNMIAIENDLIPLLEIYCYITPFYKIFLRISIKLATAGPSTATIEFIANQHFSYSSYHYLYLQFYIVRNSLWKGLRKSYW